MLWVVIALVSLIISYNAVIKFNKKNWLLTDYLFFVCTAGIAILLGFLFIILPLAIVSPATGVLVETVALEPIKNLDDNGDIYVKYYEDETGEYYHYMIKTDRGVKMQKVSVEDSFVKVVDGEASVEIHERQFNNITRVLTWFDVARHEYVFNIPRESITESFQKGK